MYSMADYESIFLATIVKNPQIIDDLDIPEYVFFTPNCQAVFSAILEAKKYGPAPDLVMIADALGKQGHKDLQFFLATLQPPDTPVNHLYYLNALIEYSRKRDIRQAIGIMSEAIEDPSVSSIELADKALETISDALQKTANRQVPTIGVLMHSYIDEIEKRCRDFENGNSEMFGMGFPELDETIGPLLPGEVVIIAARPGCGKSSLALQVADYVTMIKHKPSAYFSLEMTTFDMLDRLMAINHAGTVRELRTGKIKTSQLSDISDICSKYYESKIAIYEGSPTASMLHSRIRREVASRGTKLIVVDYLGLVDGLGADGARARWEKVGEESRALKRLALELHIVIMICVQLGRDADGTEPSIAMLRDSGCLAGNTIVNQSTIKDYDGKYGFKVYSNDSRGTVLLDARKGFYSGEKQTYTLKLNSGHEIRATANHKFLTDGREWTRLDNLEIGSMVGLSLGDVNKPQTISDEILKLLGLFIGNGCMLERHSLQYTSNKLDEDICNEIVDLANKVFPEQLHPFIKKQKFRTGTEKESEAINVYFPANRHVSRKYHNPLVQMLRDFGIYNRRANEKTIPREVFEQPIEAKILFLKYLWATDGTIGYQEKGKRKISIAYSTSSKELANQVQYLLQSVGILSNIGTIRQGKFTWYNITIYSKYFISKFINEIGIAGQRKGNIVNFCREKLETISNGWTKYKLSDDKSIVYVPVKSIEPYGTELVYDIEVPETHNFVANGFIVHNSLEQDADRIILLYGDPTKENDEQRDITFKIGKNRHGAMGKITLRFDGPHTRFHSMGYK